MQTLSRRFVLAAIVLWVMASAHATHAQNGWTVADLGTLGGLFGNAADINEAGHVVGDSSDLAGNRRAFLWTPSDGMVDLGTLGGTRSEARAINDLGHVVGSSNLTDSPGSSTHAFLWTEAAGMIDLGALGEIFPGFSFSGATDVNNAGQVVGGSSIATGDTHAFLWTSSGGMVDLGTLGGANSRADAINDAGQVAGRSETASGEEHAFLWTMSTGMVDLGTLGGASSAAHDINAAGQVVGQSDTTDGDLRAFLWTDSGGMVDLGEIGGEDSRIQAEGINDFGEVVGLFKPSDGNDRAFYWTSEDGFVELPTLTGIESAARKINNASQPVGYGDIETGDAHAVIWSQGANPPTPEEQIESLQASIQALITEGSLNTGQANALTKPLLNALSSLERSHLTPACAQLYAFQAEVTGKVLGGVLSPEDGLALIEAAAGIRSALGC